MVSLRGRESSTQLKCVSGLPSGFFRVSSCDARGSLFQHATDDPRASHELTRTIPQGVLEF